MKIGETMYAVVRWDGSFTESAVGQLKLYEHLRPAQEQRDRLSDALGETCRIIRVQLFEVQS